MDSGVMVKERHTPWWPLVILSVILSVHTVSLEAQAKSGPGASDSQRSCIIGLVPEQNIFRQVKRYSPVVDYMAKQTGIGVTLKPFASYEDVVKNLAEGSIDGAFFGSFACAVAQQQIGVETLVRPEGLDGSSVYHGLMFVRKDSGIRSVEEMRGKRFAFVNSITTAGYLLPVFYFSSKGVKDFSKYLGEFYFAGTHEDAVYDVLNRRADIGVAKNTVFHRLAARDPSIRANLKILTRSPDVPETTLAFRVSFNASARHRIRDALLTMHEKPDGAALLKTFGARRFVPTTKVDYTPVYDYARQARIDLRHFRPKDRP